MRIISGQAKGKTIRAPRGKNTRPITDMIKEALFNVLGRDISGSTFLDLFAGSGSVGIEALSRGARQVVLVDSSPEAVNIIYDNLQSCHLNAGSEVYRNDVFRAVGMLEKRLMKYNFIYVDPPFDQEHLFDKIMTELGKGSLVTPEGLVIIRTHRKKTMLDRYNVLSRMRMNQYGESVLHYYCLDKEEKGHDGDLSGS